MNNSDDDRKKEAMYREMAAQAVEDERKLCEAIRAGYTNEEWDTLLRSDVAQEFAKDWLRGEIRPPQDESVTQDTPLQRDRASARVYAKGKWDTDRTITIKSMAEDIQQTLRFEGKKQYRYRTIYNWIRDLAPTTEHHKPGRRPKKIT